MLQAFSGTQNVSSPQKDEAWRVNVRIQGCDLDHGYLCGTMEALNVPMADTPVSVSLSIQINGGYMTPSTYVHSNCKNMNNEIMQYQGKLKLRVQEITERITYTIICLKYLVTLGDV